MSNLPPKKPSPEEEYFYAREQDLLAKLRKKAESEAQRQGLGEATGIGNEEILEILREMGFDRETVVLLFLIPLLQIAWSDGHLEAKERALILEASHAYGIKEDHPAYQKLQGWLHAKPPKEIFERALRVIGEIMSFQTAEQRDIIEHKLVDACERVAAASGGFLGLGSKVSAAEKAILKRVATAIADAHPESARGLLGDRHS